jgi:prepilin-type N-terminal cleavage/methylation domain
VRRATTAENITFKRRTIIFFDWEFDMNNSCLLKAFAGSGCLHRCGARSGFTLIEVLLALVILAVLAAIALPYYGDYRQRALIAQAKGDIREMEVLITRYYADHRAFPVTLADIGKATLLDPWKKPYQYLDVTDIKATKGQARKDKQLVPINSDYDLYSMGKDGVSAAPLTAKSSQDDVIRANNGRFLGLGSEY